MHRLSHGGIMEINGLDVKDNQIVALLRQNARLTCSEIGEKVGLSRTAVKNRMTALEKSGIIKGYTAIVDPHYSPEMMTFISTVETEPGAYDQVAELLKGEKCVVTLCQVTGECILHAVCVAENVNEMRDFARKVRNAHPGVKRFFALSVLDVMKGSVLPE